MSGKASGTTAKIIPFPARKPRAGTSGTAADMKSPATSRLLAVVERCWYHDEAVAETRKG